MGRLSDKSQARRAGISDRAIRKRREVAKALSLSPDPGELADVRYRNARAAREEDRLARSRGELIHVSELRAAVRAAIYACKSRLLTLPDLARVEIGLTEKQAAVIAHRVNEALNELAAMKWNS